MEQKDITKNKIIINKKGENVNILVYENDKLVEIYNENVKDKRLEGNIYIGQVKDVVKGMQSAFIDIGQEKNALIHIKDLIPKESDITGNNEIDISKYNICKMIKPNDRIIIQVKRDSSMQKGAKVTKDIKIIGRYVILMPYSKFITASKKIEDKSERDRLIKEVKNIVKNNKNYDDKSMGIILRTSSENQNTETLKKDVENVINEWNKILRKSEEQKEPSLIYDNDGIVGKIINDFAPLQTEFYTNSKEILELIKEIDSNIDIKLDKSKNEEILLERNIKLKCGGYVTIDQTEALIAIDVNSWKYTGKKELEDTVLKVNMEAAKEIAKQIRLRDLGGIIVIDFIDMENEEDRKKVRDTIVEETKKDRSKVQVLEFTKLGLLELTRKRIFGK